MKPDPEIVISNRPMMTKAGEIFSDRTIFMVLRRDGDKVNLTEISTTYWPDHLPLGRTIGSVEALAIEPMRPLSGKEWDWGQLADLADAFREAKATPGRPQPVRGLEMSVTIHLQS